MPHDFTPEDIRRVIDTYVAKCKRVPKPLDLVKILEGLNPNQIQPHLLSYIKTLPKLIVLPSGHVRTAEGEQVWFRNSAGSMTLARYKSDPTLGVTISG